ncbi:MAG: hypothetical protein KJ579_02675 [Verrucomicrobia bacterium]|nr:hypothetical protein [Verrucomicrobiota bacterium]
MTLQKALPFDLSVLTPLASSTMAAGVAGGFLLAIALKESAPARFAGVEAAVAGWALTLALAVLGVQGWRKVASGPRAGKAAKA